MGSKANPKDYRGEFRKGVNLHRDIHKTLGQMALDEDSNRQEIVHRLLCDALGRPDLLPSQTAELATSSQS